MKENGQRNCENRMDPILIKKTVSDGEENKKMSLISLVAKFVLKIIERRLERGAIECMGKPKQVSRQKGEQSCKLK
jgi:hypothetical protein